MYGSDTLWCLLREMGFSIESSTRLFYHLMGASCPNSLPAEGNLDGYKTLTFLSLYMIKLKMTGESVLF